MLSQLFVLRRSKNFTSSVAVRMPPSVSINHYLGSRENQQNKTEVLFHHSMLYYSGEGMHLLGAL